MHCVIQMRGYRDRSGYIPREMIQKRFRWEWMSGSYFLVNPKGEANKGGPIRPMAAKFSPGGDEFYVVDFGILGSTEEVTKPRPGSGSLWRIVGGGQRYDDEKGDSILDKPSFR